MPRLFYTNENNDIIKKMITILEPEYIISPKYAYNDYKTVEIDTNLSIYSKSTIKYEKFTITIGQAKIKIFTQNNPNLKIENDNIINNISELKKKEKLVSSNPNYDISLRNDYRGRIYSRPPDNTSLNIPICLDISITERYGTDLLDDIYNCLSESEGSKLMISYLYGDSIDRNIIHFVDKTTGIVTEKFIKKGNKKTNLLVGGYKTKMSKLNFNKKKKSKKIKKYK